MTDGTLTGNPWAGHGLMCVPHLYKSLLYPKSRRKTRGTR
nr:MAG TPA: hypothetical protein [Caudoviricetes sp.]